MSNDHGRKISRIEANELIDNGAKIKTKYDGRIEGLIIASGYPVNVRNFYSSPHNGYIFDKELIERFFDAKYLLVLQCAAVDGTPTVLLAGCNDGDKEGSFKTLAIDDPATQHPPKQFMAELPLAFTEDKKSYEIAFTLVE